MARKKQTEIEESYTEDIIHTDFCDEMSSSYIDYAVSVITDRALPDVRDGLKPVHRRILWSMKSLGLSSNSGYKKSARVVGETMGKFHPHGDASIYDAMVHMAQDWCYNHPLVDGHGNYGSVEGDDAAASRYTETRLSPIAEDMLLSDLDKDTVDFIPNFDNNEKEPTVLPAGLPNILITGTDGIAVGMASKMPTHNLAEVADAAVALLEKPRMTDYELMDCIKGPDFATGGIIVNKSDLPEIYKNGAGRIRIRGKVEIREGQRGKTNIVITEIPYTMIGSIDKFMDSVAELSRTKLMSEVTDIKNLSGKEGICIVIEVSRAADVEQYVNMLYKKCKLEDTFGYNAMLLSGGVPYQMGLRRILTEFLDFYRETLTRKYKNLLMKEKKQAEIKEGLIKAVDCIDAIIELLRGSPDVATAKKCLMKGTVEGVKFKTKGAEKIAKMFSFTEAQADAILEMKLQKLIGLEMNLLVKELEKNKKNIESYNALLSSKSRMSTKMKSEMLELKKKYAKPRKTEIIDADAIVLKKPEVKQQQVYALVNRFGYIKLADEATFERNRANVYKDYKYVCPVMNTGKLYIFTDNGKCHQVKAENVPYGKYNEKGVPLENISSMDKSENFLCVCSAQHPKNKLLFVTESGLVKKVYIGDFESSRKTTDATKLNEGDKLIFVGEFTEGQNAVLISKKGFGVAFDGSGLAMLKKNAQGVIGMKFDKGDSLEIVTLTDENGLFTMDEKEYDLKKLGLGKRGTKGKQI